MSPLKVRSFSSKQHNIKSNIWKTISKHWACHSWFQDGGTTLWGHGDMGIPYMIKAEPRWWTVRKKRPQFSNYKKRKKNLLITNELGEKSQIEPKPYWHLDFSPVRHGAGNLVFMCQTSDTENYLLKYGHCFKLLCL